VVISLVVGVLGFKFFEALGGHAAISADAARPGVAGQRAIPGTQGTRPEVGLTPAEEAEREFSLLLEPVGDRYFFR